MGAYCETNVVFLLVVLFAMYFVIALTKAHPLQNPKTLETDPKQHRSETGKEDGAAGIHSVSKRFARPDTSGVFLNHFPVTNLLSTPDNTRRKEAVQRQKTASRSSAFRQTHRVIESNSTPTEWTRDHNLQQRSKTSDSLPNANYKNSLVRKRLNNHATRDNDRKDKVQAWKDLTDKLMDSWSYLDSETTTSGGVQYVHETPSLAVTTKSENYPVVHGRNYLPNEKQRTTPVMREGVQHGPAIVRTRVPNTRQTMIGYAESFTKPVSNPNDQFNGGYVTEPSVFNTNTPSTTTVYQIKRPTIKTDSIDSKITPNTGRKIGRRYDITPHQYDQSVYHKPSRFHTRTLVTKSWKTTEHGLPSVSISVPDTEYSDYTLVNNTSRPRGYDIPLSKRSDTHNTRASQHVVTRPYDQEILINNTTDTFLESFNSKISYVTRGDAYETSTVETHFVESTPKQNDMVTLQSGTSEQNINSDIYFTSTNEYLFSESTPNEHQTSSSGGDATELTSNSNLSTASTVAYHTDTTTPNYDQMTLATGGTTDHNNTPIETARIGQNSHTTPVYAEIKNEGIPNILNLKVDQTRVSIEGETTIVSEGYISTTTTQKPVSFTKTPLPRTPTKMKVYDIKEILKEEVKGKIQAENVRKTTPMKVYDITDPVTDEAKVATSIRKRHKLDRKNNPESQSKHNTNNGKLISKTKSSEAYTGQQMIQDVLKVQKSFNNTNIVTNSKKTPKGIKENVTSDGKPRELGRGQILEVQDRAVVTKSQHQDKNKLKTTKYHGTRLAINQKIPAKKINEIGQKLIERKASAKWNEINVHVTNTDSIDSPSKQQQQTLDKNESAYDKPASNDMSNTNLPQYNDEDVTVHHHNSSTCNNSDTQQITRAISVIKELLNKIQSKPTVKALPRPHRQRYLLIPLGNLTFTEVKQKLLAYQTYMQEFQNDNWSDNSLVNDVNTDTDRPIVLDHRPTQR